MSYYCLKNVHKMFCRPMRNTLTVKAYYRKIGIQGTCPCSLLEMVSA